MELMLYAYRFALSSSSKYVFAKQPSTPEVYSTSTDNAMNLSPLDIHIPTEAWQPSADVTKTSPKLSTGPNVFTILSI